MDSSAEGCRMGVGGPEAERAAPSWPAMPSPEELAEADRGAVRELVRLVGDAIRLGPFQLAVVMGAGFAIGSGAIYLVVGFFVWALGGAGK